MKKILLSCLVLCLFGCSSTQANKKVVVIGGGLAGLTAAHELEQKHYQVTLLEAADRLGGRVVTNTFPNGQYSEGGAELIDSKNIHPLIHEYVEKFGLAFSDIGYDDPKIDDGAYYLNSTLFSFDDLEKTLGEEVANDEEKFWNELYELGQKLPDAQNPQIGRYAKELDAMSALQWVKSLNLNSIVERVALHHIRSEYGEPSGLSTLFLAQQQKAYENIEDDEIEIYRIKEGNSKLVSAFTKSIKGEVYTSNPVTKIKQNDKGLTVTTSNGKNYIADYAVVAVPASVLNKIEFEPALPNKLVKASQLNYGYHNKVALQFKSRFWLKRGLGGDVLSELPVGWVWEGTDQQEGITGILVTYTSGAVAHEEDSLSDEQVVAKRLNEINQMYPESKGEFIGAIVNRWSRSPWLNAGFTGYAPQQVVPYWNAFHQPFNHVYFAGEHTDDLLPGFMEGAIRSGRRVANQIHSK